MGSNEMDLGYSETVHPEAVSNKDMQCADCVYAEAKPALCKKYGWKPDAVMIGYARCEGYEKQQG